jgi:SOS-response transcriptional repressor LexA
MSPNIPDGSIVWVREQPDVENGEICVVTVGDGGYCRIKGKDGFEAVNPKYPTIKYSDCVGDTVFVSGKVVYVQK